MKYMTEFRDKELARGLAAGGFSVSEYHRDIRK